jgi:hypothetical protein
MATSYTYQTCITNGYMPGSHIKAARNEPVYGSWVHVSAITVSRPDYGHANGGLQVASTYRLAVLLADVRAGPGRRPCVEGETGTNPLGGYELASGSSAIISLFPKRCSCVE